MVNCIEYVTKERFEELRKLYPNAKYELNMEFPATETLIFLFVDKKFAVTIKYDCQDDADLFEKCEEIYK